MTNGIREKTRTSIRRRHPGDRPAHRWRTGLLLPQDEPHRFQAGRVALERDGDRALDGRGRVCLHQPQHPDPFLIGVVLQLWPTATGKLKRS